MEYVDGVSLQAAVARHGPFAPAEAAAVGRQVLLGLHAAHAAGVVHRDVKPANILLDRQGTAKLTDLGIVRVEGEELTRMAGTPQILGTLDYLAPEQAADSSAVDGRADLYSLGATLYFLLAGRPPFAAAATASRKLALIRAAAPPPLDETRADLPPTLAAVVHRLLAKRPAERATAAEAADALGRSADPPAGFPARLFAPPTVARPARVAEADTLPCRPSAVTPPPGRAEPSDRRPKTDLQLPRT
jgi:serine/threonine-protein kinase